MKLAIFHVMIDDPRMQYKSKHFVNQDNWNKIHKLATAAENTGDYDVVFRTFQNKKAVDTTINMSLDYVEKLKQLLWNLYE